MRGQSISSLLILGLSSCGPSGPPPKPEYVIENAMIVDGRVWSIDVSTDRSQIALSIVKQGWNHLHDKPKSGDVSIYTVKDDLLVHQYRYSPNLIRPVALGNNLLIGYDNVENRLRINRLGSSSEVIFVEAQADEWRMSEISINPDERFAILEYGRNEVNVLDLETLKMTKASLDFKMAGHYNTKGAFVDTRTFVSGFGQWYHVENKTSGEFSDHLSLAYDDCHNKLSGRYFVFPSEGKSVYAIIDSEGLSVRNVADHSMRWRVDLDLPGDRICDLRFDSTDRFKFITKNGKILLVNNGIIEKQTSLLDYNPEMKPIFTGEFSGAYSCFVDVDDLIITIEGGQLIRTTVDMPF